MRIRRTTVEYNALVIIPQNRTFTVPRRNLVGPETQIRISDTYLWLHYLHINEMRSNVTESTPQNHAAMLEVHYCV